MSAGKLAAQVSHGSMAFLTTLLRNNATYVGGEVLKGDYYFETMSIDKDLYQQWIDREYTKCILQAKNKNNLMRAVTIAEELGMKEGEDYFLIYDNCHTELKPEEDGRTLTCIGFKPMESEIIGEIGKKFHLYMG
jgi:PTH2 family peptidyl-tRNA hydrolase